MTAAELPYRKSESIKIRGTIELIVGCARCHDHKFDPLEHAFRHFGRRVTRALSLLRNLLFTAPRRKRAECRAAPRGEGATIPEGWCACHDENNHGKQRRVAEATPEAFMLSRLAQAKPARGCETNEEEGQIGGERREEERDH